MTGLAGRHAVVTGGGTGIGAAVALALAGAGARVTVTGRREAPLRETAARHAGIGWAVADVTDYAATEAMLAAAGAPDILVANAGAATGTAFRKLAPETFAATLAVNLAGVFHLWRAGLGRIGGWGRLVAIGSTAGLKGYPFVADYVAAKHGVVGLTRALAVELAGDPARADVTVNAVCPGYVDTPLLDRTVAEATARSGRDRDAVVASLVASNPQRRLIAADEVAGAVLWLCSDAARSVTGQAIAISGGET